MPMEDSKERTRAVEAAVSQIEKQFGKGSIMRLGQKDAIAASSHPDRRLASTSRSASAACRAAASSRSTVRSRPARRRWRCT